MSVVKNACFRWLTKGLVTITAVDIPDDQDIESWGGSLSVKSSLGGTVKLDFPIIVLVDPELVKKEDIDGDTLASVQFFWPKEAPELRNGLTLCELTRATRSYLVALGLFQIGDASNWWRLEYDPNAVCDLVHEDPDYVHCILRVSQLNTPAGRPRKKREWKFALPSFLLPRPGFAHA